MAFVPAHLPARSLDRRVVFAAHARGVLARKDGERFVLPLEHELAGLGIAIDDRHHLGELDEAHAEVIPLLDLPTLSEGYEVLPLRAMAAAFDAELFAVAGRALHVTDFVTTTRFCGRCGARTERSPTERAVRCPSCALTVYPRIAPAIITLVRRGPEALLARNARFPGAFYSTLAGFSEIGESLEETLVREVHEEVGVHVKDVRYFGSQPWPFPHSLMVGFTAEWESGDIRIDEGEIADARWFRADNLPQIPPRLSIARKLIDAWVDEVGGAR